MVVDLSGKVTVTVPFSETVIVVPVGRSGFFFSTAFLTCSRSGSVSLVTSTTPVSSGSFRVTFSLSLSWRTVLSGK